MEDTKRAWIGMSDTATSGGFQFVDGTPYVYSDWSPESIQWLYAQKSSSDLKSKCIYATSSGWGYKVNKLILDKSITKSKTGTLQQYDAKLIKSES